MKNWTESSGTTLEFFADLDGNRNALGNFSYKVRASRKVAIVYSRTAFAHAVATRWIFSFTIQAECEEPPAWGYAAEHFVQFPKTGNLTKFGFEMTQSGPQGRKIEYIAFYLYGRWCEGRCAQFWLMGLGLI